LGVASLPKTIKVNGAGHGIDEWLLPVRRDPRQLDEFPALRWVQNS
jgi:hypothetical protein